MHGFLSLEAIDVRCYLWFVAIERQRQRERRCLGGPTPCGVGGFVCFELSPVITTFTAQKLNFSDLNCKKNHRNESRNRKG